jgi:S1-C subfamily serine protease
MRRTSTYAGWLVVCGALLVFALVGVAGLWLVVSLLPRLLPKEELGVPKVSGVARVRGAIPPQRPAVDLLANVKKATVFIRVEDQAVPAGNKPLSWSGTGVVVKVEEGSAYVVTSAHGLVPGLPQPPVGQADRPSLELPPEGAAWNAPRGHITLELPEAIVSPSLITSPVAVDPENDLAILKVTGDVASLQTAALDAPVPQGNSLQVSVLGLPEGETLGAGQRGPTPSVLSATLVVTRPDRNGEPGSLQLNIDLPPGHAGGPVVDPEGHLLGVLPAAGLKSNARLVIPVTALRKILEGRIGPRGLFIQQATRDRAVAQFFVRLIWPLGGIKSVTLHYAVADQPDAFPASLHGLDESPGHRMVKLDHANPSSVLEVQSGGRPWRVLSVVTAVETANGIVTAGPDFFEVDFERPANYFAGPPGQEIFRDAAAGDSSLYRPVPHIVRLPGPAGEGIVGGAGRYLLLPIPEAHRLAVFDASVGRLVRVLPLPQGRVACAASRDKFVLTLPQENIIQRWSLATFEREAAATMPLPVTLTGVAMGPGSDGPLLAGSTLIDLHSLHARSEHLPVQWQAFANQWERREGQVRASTDGRLFVYRNYRTNQAAMYSLGSPTIHEPRENNYWNFVLPGDNGRVLCTARGLLGLDWQPFGPVSVGPFICVPAVRGPYFIGFRHVENLMTPGLYVVGEDRPIELLSRQLFKVLEKMGQWPYWPEESIYLFPEQKVLALLPPERDRLFLYRFDVDRLVAASRLDYLLVSSQPPTTARRGQTFTYPIRVLSRRGGVTYRLNAGPLGMQIGPDGKLSWVVPADFADKDVSVIVTIRDAGGQERFHTFFLTVLDPGEG